MENVAPEVLSEAFSKLVDMLGDEREFVLLIPRVEGEELVVQYATTMELPVTVQALRDSADAIEGREPCREAELN